MDTKTTPLASLDEDITCDVLVAGAGGGGLATAVMAAALGLRVVIIEKSSVVGGSTAISGGGAWVPCSSHSVRAGIEDNKAQARAYLAAHLGEFFRPELVDAFLDNAPAALDFLEASSEVRFRVATDVPDYYPQCPGSTMGGRSLDTAPYDGRRLGAQFKYLRRPLATLTVLHGMMIPREDVPFFQTWHRSFRSFARVARRALRHGFDLAVWGRATRLANGNALAARLFRSALDSDIPIVLNTRLVELISENGRVAGAFVEGRSGSARKTRRFRVDARYGVVVACGGFPWNEALKARLYPHVATGKAHRSLVPDTNAGESLGLVRALGGRLDTHLAHPAAWVPASEVPQRDGSSVLFPHFVDFHKAGFILVNRRGKRFVNESLSYQEVTPTIIAAIAEEATPEVYLICDRKTLRREGMGVVPPGPLPLRRHIRTGYLVTAPTVAALAAKLGVDGAELEASVQRFNGFVETGVDADYGRGSDAYQRYRHGGTGRVESTNPCLAPLATPPFYAVRVRPSDIGSFMGIRIGSGAAVLDQQDRPIAGLYAVGADAASVFGGKYPAGGANLGPAIVFAYLAARHLAATTAQADRQG